MSDFDQIQKRILTPMKPASQPLSEFVRQVREKTAAVGQSSGKQAAELQTALSAFIVEQMQMPMAQGLSVTEIQNALRAAVDAAPQTYAPDTSPSEDDSGEPLEQPIAETVYFLPLAAPLPG
jgi:hypothetical protein